MCHLLGFGMNKKLMIIYLLAVSLSVNAPQGAEMSGVVGASKAKKGFVETSARMVHELVVQKVSTGVSAASSITMQAITSMAGGSSVSPFKALLSSVRMQEDTYHLSHPVTKVVLVHGAMLLVSKGSTNSLTCLTLPENRDKIVCHHDKDTLVLGTQLQKWSKEAKSGEFDHRCATTVFRLTYVGAMPALEIGGQGFLQIVGNIDGEVGSITLKDAATGVASGVEVGILNLNQHGLSKLTIDRVSVKNLNYACVGASSASISGLVAENSVEVSLVRPPSIKGEAIPLLRLQGQSPHLRAILGSHAALDARECVAHNVHVTTQRGFSSAIVNASGSLVVDGKKTGGFIEYAGDPQSITNSSAVILKRSPIPGFLSWITGQAVAQVEAYKPTKKIKKKKAKPALEVVVAAESPAAGAPAASEMLMPLGLDSLE